MGGFEYLLDPNRRIFWLYIISSLLIAGIWLRFNPSKKRLLLSKKLWLHESAKVDYVFFVLSFFIKTFLIVPLVFSAKSVTLFVLHVLINTFGFVQINGLNYTCMLCLYTFTLFIVSDFSRYWLHRLLHVNKFLWQIHKVHHSAKVLTPITFYRVHPIENLLFGLRYSLSVGFVTGVFVYLFGAKIGLIEIFGVNVFVFVFSFFGANLRHSHVNIGFFKAIEKWIMSPKQHQMHHSIKYLHKNFGGAFSFWDRMFNSIAYSQNVKNLKFGLKTNMASYDNAFKLIYVPFIFKKEIL